MKLFYDFNQRVRMRRDPSQFGRIGRGPFAELAAKSGKTIRQFVFWEHRDADLVTCENVADLMSEEEWHERRRLFFATMRHPEMRMLRLALRYLLWDRGLEWRDIGSIQSIWVDPYAPDCWQMVTDRFQVVSLNVSLTMTYEDFWFSWIHNMSDPLCDCEDCQNARVCYVHMKDYYIAQEQNASA